MPVNVCDCLLSNIVRRAHVVAAAFFLELVGQDKSQEGSNQSGTRVGYRKLDSDTFVGTNRWFVVRT
jgi:hypothetical protein